jgi:tetratricopeptide (TPR) repeat protein
LPSLNALNEFKDSFSNIANEKKDVLAKELPLNDLDLPGKEAPPMVFSRPSSSPPVADDSPELNAENSADGEADGFDFNAFFDSLPTEISAPAMDEPPSIDDLLNDTSLQSSNGDADSASQSADLSADSSFDDNILSDDFMSSLTGDTDNETEAVTSDDFGDFDSENLGYADFSGESSDFDPSGDNFEDTQTSDMPMSDTSISDTPVSEDESLAETDDNLDLSEGIDLGGESPDIDIKEPDSSSFDDPVDIDFPIRDTELGSGSEPSAPDADFSGEDFDLGGESETPLPDSDFSGEDFDLGGESETSLPDSDFSAEDFDLGSDFETPLPETDFPIRDTELGSGSEPSASDSDFSAGDMDLGSDFETPLPDSDFSGEDFDLGGEQETSSESGAVDFGSDFASDSIDLDSGFEGQSPELGESFGDDDFSLSGLDEILERSKTEIPAQPAQKRSFFQRKKAKTSEEPADEKVEEIQLSQDDLEKLLKTLASYPLNLRIVCEELIAEQVLLPQQLSKLIRLLVNGAHVREAADFAHEVTGKQIVIPKSFEKMTGAAFEAEQASFAYIFINNFLPVLRLFAVIAAMAASVFFLAYRFVYIPIKAENLYKRGYERIPAGEYQRANQLFSEAFSLNRKKKWFYLYAESFRDQRRYLLAEEKYDELLLYYPRDKKGVLDYARLNTYYLMNYDKANRLLQQQLLDYAPNDYDGLISAGDNFFAWADSDPSRFFDRYEDARFCYARLLEIYGWQAPVAERMMLYFIRTDNLKETLHLRAWFENDKKRSLSPAYLAELGGYLLDKQLEKTTGVPDPYIESIESVRDMLLQAIRGNPNLPEAHYHLARYHHNLGNTYEERLTLENAIRAFDLAPTETVRRRLYRVDAHFRYSNLLLNNREFFPAEENVIKSIQLYEDYLSRNLIRATPQLGQLYAAKGNLEYFVKTGNMRAALSDYHNAERYGYAPPEIQYRMGAAYYQLEDWGNSLDYLFKAAAELPLNRRLLYALGNVTYQRGDYFAAQGYFNRLIDTLEYQRIRLPVLLPNDDIQFLELGERLMMARNNAGAVHEALAEQTGNREYRITAMALYAESARAWDSITRNPETMIRMRLTGSENAPGINLAYINAASAMRPARNYRPGIFMRIDKDVLEPSNWEELAPFGTFN